MTELKPCPFCGNQAVYKSATEGAFLKCVQCFVGIDTQWYGGDLGLVEASWNGRAPDPELTAARERIAKLEAALFKIAETHDASAVWLRGVAREVLRP